MRASRTRARPTRAGQCGSRCSRRATDGRRLPRRRQRRTPRHSRQPHPPHLPRLRLPPHHLFRRRLLPRSRLLPRHRCRTRRLPVRRTLAPRPRRAGKATHRRHRRTTRRRRTHKGRRTHRARQAPRIRRRRRSRPRRRRRRPRRSRSTHGRSTHGRRTHRRIPPRLAGPLGRTRPPGQTRRGQVSRAPWALPRVPMVTAAVQWAARRVSRQRGRGRSAALLADWPAMPIPSRPHGRAGRPGRAAG